MNTDFLNLSSIPEFVKINIIEPFTRNLYSHNLLEDVEDVSKSFDELNYIYRKWFEYKMKFETFEMIDKEQGNCIIFHDILHIITLFQSSLKNEQNTIDFQNFNLNLDSLNLTKVDNYESKEYAMKLNYIWRKLNMKQRKHILNYIHCKLINHLVY